VSAALKQKPALTPTPFPRPERAALAHAIARAADAAARRVALEKAAQTANSDVLQAIGAVEAAEAVLAEAQGTTARHLVDKALGTAGAAPTTIREARAAVIAAQDHLEECSRSRS
jgi:multidrug resistance efflux pump